MRVTETTTREVDLGALPYTEWPESAQSVARYIVSHRAGDFLPQLPALRQSWLVARVEQWLEREPWEL